LIGAVSSVRPQIAILYELAQITFGGGEVVILPHGLRLQGYILSSNHPFVQPLDGEYQVPVVTPDNVAVVECECAELFRVLLYCGYG
jgi:hypothetical protein